MPPAARTLFEKRVLDSQKLLLEMAWTVIFLRKYLGNLSNRSFGRVQGALFQKGSLAAGGIEPKPPVFLRRGI
jgi:hypothetical protein